MGRNQRGFSSSIILGAIVAVVILVMGLFVYNHHNKTKITNSSSAIPSTSTSNAKSTNPYAGWKTYTSPFERLSFKYPPTWSLIDTTGRISAIPNADTLQLASPTKAMAVSWFSAIDGLGGACDSTIPPGAPLTSNSPGACPYWTVIDKQKLSGANLYYVDGVVTSDNMNYSPWCGLQAEGGIVKSESSIGYMLFQGKNNDVIRGGRSYSMYAGLICGAATASNNKSTQFYTNFGGLLPVKGTKQYASAYLTTPEMQQAKLILLSASY